MVRKIKGYKLTSAQKVRRIEEATQGKLTDKQFLAEYEKQGGAVIKINKSKK